ncbi:ABC-2 family transporter protein [Oceanobacillus oncorhynchi]|uniref:ABC-2 family transporter protein n=2 Tax=Oceanobacillus TaxID=182709 RepID=A0A0A1ME15_9BACI|nr:ABC-2 family transporter protein [Oceanobacillus oncorhynchi]
MRKIFKLMSLEMRKINFSRYINNSLAACFAVTGFLFFMLYIDREQFAASSTDFLFLIDSITRMVFIVFSGVLISKLVIEEYNDKTITLMFTYPISRKKIIISKLLIIIGFTFFSMLLSRIFAAFVLSMLNSNLGFIDSDITIPMLIEHFRNTILYDLSASGVSLVPLFFGMLKKSVRTTIITSVIIAIFFGVSNEDLSIGSFIGIPVTLSLIGIVASYLSIKNIEHKDIS